LFILAAAAPAAPAAAVYQRKEKKRKKPFYQPTKKTIYIANNPVLRDAIHTKDYTDGTLLFGSSTPPLLFDFSFLFGLTGAGHQQHFCVRPFPPGWLAGQQSWHICRMLISWPSRL
jgi:hypothetical protein